MRIVTLYAAVAIVGAFLGMPPQGLGEEKHEVVETLGAYGNVNWSEGMIYASGIGISGEEVLQGASDGSTARGVEADTYSKLFETTVGVRIDSSSLVKDLVEKSDMIRAQLQGMVKRAQIVKREYLSNGTLAVTLGLKMTGGLAQLALPEDVKQVPEIKAIATEAKEEHKKQTVRSTSYPPVRTTYTGLVLDARGLQGRPAMSPRIVAESGEEVYGPAYVSREFAVQQGMVAYEKHLESARNNPRVLDNPLTVRGLRIQGASRCDFVISNVDALKIRGSSENLLFLKKCRVVIVLN